MTPTPADLGKLQIGTTVKGDADRYRITNARWGSNELIFTLTSSNGTDHEVPNHDIGMTLDGPVWSEPL